MVRCGYTSAGTQRWLCKNCKLTGTKRRGDRTKKNQEKLFERWLLNTETLKRIESKEGLGKNSLSRKFEAFWDKKTQSGYRKNSDIVLVDGLHISDDCVVLIAIDNDMIPISWSFAQRESKSSWSELFIALKTEDINPKNIVSDAHKGLMLSMRDVFPDVTHQRCMAHVSRQAKLWLTKHPKTETGQELLDIISVLFKIKSEEDVKIFEKTFESWSRDHDSFLKEKSYDFETKKWWYTHRNLRRVRRLISNSMPDIFNYIFNKNLPHTTNKIEGGINSPLRALLRHHRGLTKSHKITLVARFLRSKQKKKTTRNNH
jgi:Transposase, Mutator family